MYQRVPPADDADMKKQRYLGHHTICEKCREIWRIGKETNNPELMLKAREAMAMGKRMQAKLKFYRDKTVNEETKEAAEDKQMDERQEAEL